MAHLIMALLIILLLIIALYRCTCGLILVRFDLDVS